MKVRRMANTSKPSPVYWAERMEELAQRAPRKENKIIKEMNAILERASTELQTLLNDFYQRYAENNELTLAQARQRIDRTGAQRLTNRIAQLVNLPTLTTEQAEQLERLRAKFTTTRLQLLINEMELVLIDGYGQKQLSFESYMRQAANEAQEELAGDITNFSRLSTTEIEYIVHYPWSGAEFSDRLWQNKEKLVFELNNIVTTGLIRGESTQSMARKLKERVGNGKYETERLIRTETGYILNETAAQFWEKNEVTHYIYKAKLDSRTSRVCRTYNNKKLRLSDRKIGTNYPPLHPFCRSFTIPVIEDD